MKILFLVATLVLVSQTARSEDCFSAKLNESLTDDSCGPVEAAVTLKDCKTGEVQKSFTATMGLDCIEMPHKLKLLYNNEMLVGEMAKFDESPDLILSKTYVEDASRLPASHVKPRKETGEKCFTMKPIEKINPQTCEPVRAQIQFLSCVNHKPVSDKIEVTTHYSCGREHQYLKYWYKKMMLVGELQRTKGGFKVGKTFTLIYPAIYGVYNDGRKPSSVSSNGN